MTHFSYHTGSLDETPRIDSHRSAASLSPMIAKVISGGQTGADRARLDLAIDAGVPHGGCCPKGRKAEDGTIPERYALTESTSGNYLQRTEWNARDADGTVIFTMSTPLSGGSKRTGDFATKHGNPWIHIHPDIANAGAVLAAFIDENQIGTLNVAGSRGSKEPDIAAFVIEVLSAAFPSRA
jgi:hypothetical protein